MSTNAKFRKIIRKLIKKWYVITEKCINWYEILFVFFYILNILYYVFNVFYIRNGLLLFIRNLEEYIFTTVRYLYPDGIVKYDGSSTPQIDGTISKEILLRKDIISLERLADSTGFTVHNFTIT